MASRWRTWFLRVATVLVFAIPTGVGVWMVLFGHLAPSRDIQNAGTLPEPDYAVTSVPRIGPRAYGDCTRVLSIDGGGIKGLVPALLLTEIERRTSRPIYQSFDLIVGASTGAILALGMTRPSDADARQPAFTATHLVGFYRDQAASIFPHSLGFLRSVRRAFRPQYDATVIEKVFQTYFGDVRFQEALTNVAIPAYDIEDGRRLWFLSYSNPYGQILMADLVRGATAAPTYLPPSRFAVQRHVSPKGYVALVDGALFANNPAPVALARGSRIRGSGDPSIMLISLGTGRSMQRHSFDDAKSWGMLGWMDPLLEIAFSDPAIDDEMNRSLEGKGNYFRLQPDFAGVAIALDDSSPETLRRLEHTTDRYIQKHSDVFTRLAADLALPRSPQCGPLLGADYERPEGPRSP